ncbi:MAG: chitobiase/beta-hexosaminidase C-terminal domain-containing protein [Muribaculaceae bacterium]|nr:chitobiase/beta-hexosaminidase C-terminal domain-containing protein [Muribaculaceae bacterium]
MKRILLSYIIAALACLPGAAAERSFSIVFGASTAGTTSLTNENFVANAVREGAGYIDRVTSVVNVFPETDGIKLSSSKKNGKFNIHLAEDAQVVASRIVVSAKRYDNDKDAEANIMLNSETLMVPSLDWAEYTLAIPSRPEKTLTNLIVDAECRLYIESITIYYDDAQGTVEPELETVETPVISPAGGSVTAGTHVEIRCATTGADIYYTIDGSDPSTGSLLYEGPISINNDLLLKAFATKEGMKPSALTSAAFTVRTPAASLESTFDFSQPTSLTPAIAEPAQKESVDLDGRSFSEGDVVVSFKASESGNTHVRLYHSYDAGIDLRLYDGDAMVVRTMNPGFHIKEIRFTMSLSGASTGSGDLNLIPSTGSFDWASETWTPEEGYPEQSVELTSAMQSRIASMTVVLDRSSGLHEILPDHDHEAVYYNIMGRRISAQTLAPGLYIKVAGGETKKVLVRP